MCNLVETSEAMISIVDKFQAMCSVCDFTDWFMCNLAKTSKTKLSRDKDHLMDFYDYGYRSLREHLRIYSAFIVDQII